MNAYTHGFGQTSVMASSGSHLPIIKHCLAYMVSQGIVNGEGTTLLPLSYAIAMNDGGMNPNLAGKPLTVTALFRVLTDTSVPTSLQQMEAAYCILPTGAVFERRQRESP